MTTHFVPTARGRFCVKDTGGEGAPLVLLHGWPESSYCWQGVVPHLSPSFRLLMPDLRGLGDSERTPGINAYQKTELAQDVLALLDALGVGDFALVGHDWGGVVAQEMAFVAPARVRQLVISNIVLINNLRGNLAVREAMLKTGNLHNWYQQFMQQKDLPEALIKGNEETWLRHFLKAWNGPFPEAAIREYVRCYQIEGTPGTAANYYRAFPLDTARWATLAGTRHPMPSLYLYGNRDVVIIPPYLAHAEDCFEDFQVVEIEAGHFVPEEQPAAVATALHQFLRPRG